jgi:hypothetical protein
MDSMNDASDKRRWCVVPFVRWVDHWARCSLNLFETYVRRQASVVSIHGLTLFFRGLGPQSVAVDLGVNVGEFSTGMKAQFGIPCHAIKPIAGPAPRSPERDRIHVESIAAAAAEEQFPLFWLVASTESSGATPSRQTTYNLLGLDLAHAIGGSPSGASSFRQ